MTRWIGAVVLLPFALGACGSSEVGSAAGVVLDTVLVAGDVADELGSLLSPVGGYSLNQTDLIVGDLGRRQVLQIHLPTRQWKELSPMIRGVVPGYFSSLPDGHVLAGFWTALGMAGAAVGEWRSLAVPASAWGTRAVGPLIVEPSGAVVTSPAASSVLFAQLRLGTNHARQEWVRFSPGDSMGTPIGPSIMTTRPDKGDALKAWTVFAGFRHDSLVAVRLWDGRVSALGLPSYTNGVSCSVSAGEADRPFYRDSLNVALKLRFQDARMLDDVRLVVLTNRSYKWLSWLPWTHRPGKWTTRSSLEVIDSHCAVVRSVPLPSVGWRWLAVDRRSRSVFVGRTRQEGRADEAVVLRATGF